MVSRAWPVAAPPVTSLRPSRLAIRIGAVVASAGRVMPAGGVTSLAADAVLAASMARAAPAARAAPMPQTRRDLVVVTMVLSFRISGRRGVHRPHRRLRRRTNPVHQTAVTFIALPRGIRVNMRRARDVTRAHPETSIRHRPTQRGD